MKKIIAVYGAANVGKTSAIRRMCAEMLKDGATIERVFPSSTYRFENSVEKIIQELSDVSKNEDIVVTISYKGLKIGFSSMGDCRYETTIFANLEELGKDSCNLIICATRTRGRTCQAVRIFAGNRGYELQWFTNTLINFDALLKLTTEVIKTNI